jgi:hypothetical protein
MKFHDWFVCLTFFYKFKAYQNILLSDLDYALDKKVEQDLWNCGFKNKIENLQLRAKDKKNPRRVESQTLLTLTLQAGTGFYICLLHQICDTFKLDLPFRLVTSSNCFNLVIWIPSTDIRFLALCHLSKGRTYVFHNQRHVGISVNTA